MEEIIGKLTKEQYWEWRFKIAEMQKCQEKILAAERLGEMMRKDIEIAQLKVALYKNHVEQTRINLSSAKDEYESFKKDLTTIIGFEITDCIIDEITLEVKKITS